MLIQQFKQLTHLVENAQRILVVSHANCGDATGAVTACDIVLSRLGKTITTFLPKPVSASLQFLPLTERILSDVAKIRWPDYDLVLCVDAGEPKLTGLFDMWHSRPATLPLVNFDHHLTNPEYGDFNIVNKAAPATCAMLYEWFVSAGYLIDRRVATCLLTGILTDTGTFLNSATNEVALQTASTLLLAGAQVGVVLEKIIHNKTIIELKLWGRALERLRENTETGVVSTAILQADVTEFSLGVEAVDGVANFLNDLQGPRAVLVLKEQADGMVKGSYRTTRDDVDVAAMAKVYGGGGHRKAAGFTVAGKLVELAEGWGVEVV